MRKVVCSVVIALVLFGFTSCGANDNENRVVIYTAAEEERITYLQDELEAKFPDYEVIFQSLGTGPLVTRLQAEGTNTECDIFYDLETANAELLINSNNSIFYDLSDQFDMSIYIDEVRPAQAYYAVDCKTDVAFVVNRDVLTEYGCPVPEKFEDLLNPCYKGLISMPDPKSSGTGYAFFNGMVTKLGEEKAMEYFDALNENIKEYTSSGSAPLKAVDRGEIAIGCCMVWQGVQYANNNPSLQVIFPDNEVFYNLFAMGIVNGKQDRAAVIDVFTYLFNDLNQEQVLIFTPDRIYRHQGEALIPNYPEGLTEIDMNGQFDYLYKQALLDKWVY